MLVVVGLGGLYRRLLGIHASAPAFVFFTVPFIWCFYLLMIRKGVSLVMGFVLNGEAVLLITGLYSMLKSDPGLVEPSNSDKLVESSVSELSDHDEDSVSGRRVRHCKICKGYIKGFDHHCPAFGNCIGKKKLSPFHGSLVGFLVTEDAVKSEISSILSSEVNWKKYPEVHLTDQHQPGQSSTEIRFTNPYNKGILQNVKEFMSLKEQ